MIACFYALSASCTLGRVRVEDVTKPDPAGKKDDPTGKKTDDKKTDPTGKKTDDKKTDPTGKKTDPTGKKTDDKKTDPTGKKDDKTWPIEEKVLAVMYVVLKEGLPLRTAPTLSADVIASAPLNAPLEVLEFSQTTETIEGMSARWARVRHEGKIGWAFTAYLSEKKQEDRTLTIEELKGAYRDSEISAKLLDEEGQIIGRLRKKPGSSRFEIDTLRRTCGRGLGDKQAAISDAAAVFYLQYLLCNVDPGDSVNVRCINCDLIKYECSLPFASFSLHKPGDMFEQEITCKIVDRKFCARNCKLDT